MPNTPHKDVFNDTADDAAANELRELVEEAVSHAVERRASLTHKEEVLLDVLISDTSPTSPTASKTSSGVASGQQASKMLTRHGPLVARMRHKFPHLTDEQVEELIDVT